MKFLQIRKRKMKFPPGTGLRGQPAAAATHADTWPRHTARARGLGAGCIRPSRTQGPAGSPTLPATYAERTPW